jgi:hypothetical protein
VKDLIWRQEANVLHDCRDAPEREIDGRVR